MSYDPSRRAMPPRQGGWPQATPPRAWPAYRDDNADRDADQAAGQDEATGEGSSWAAASSPSQPTYQGEPGYQGQPAYQRELAYQGLVASRGQSGYQAQAAYESDPAYQGTTAYQGHPAYQGQPGYGAQPDYRPEPAYGAEPGYQGQPGYGTQPEPTYGTQPGYQGQPGYGTQPDYRPEPAYGTQPGYQGQAAYGAEPGYQAETGYGTQPGYQGQAAYRAEPGYQAEGGYGVRPDYRAEVGYQGAFDGSDDHEYRDYRPTRVIEPLPAAPDGYAYGGGGHDDHSGVAGYYGEPADAFDGGGFGVATDAARNGYGAPDAYADYGNGTGQSGQGYRNASRGGYGLDVDGAADGYGLDVDGAADGYGLDVDGAADGYGLGGDGAAGGGEFDTDGTAADDYRGRGYRDRSYYAEPRSSALMLVAPDAGVLPDKWQADRDRRQERRRRGVLVGAVTGFLATAVAIGVTTLAAALLRPPVSPVVAVGNVFLDRTPAALRNLVAAHFGSHGRTVLLLGMYVVIALLAMTIGVLTRRAPALGVASVAAGVLVAAFVAMTRPQGGPTEVIPWVIGGIAGVAALLWLVRSSAPVVPVRPARGGNRRRA